MEKANIRPRQKLTDTEEKIRIELYKQGLSDTEIARRLNLTQPAVSGWRSRRGLPSHYKAVFEYMGKGEVRLEEADELKRLRLYKKGLTYTEIAEEVGVYPSTISTWVNRRNLKCKRKLKENVWNK